MEVTGKFLLNQAETILKDRKQDSRSSSLSSGDAEAAQKSPSSRGISHNAMESRMLTLQDSLRKTQEEFSFEQTRLTYLNQHRQDIHEDLKFEDRQLFPELEAGKLPESLQDTVSHRLEELSRNLKGIQVEMENLYALNFNRAPGSTMDTADLSRVSQSNRLDPARVARLTE